MILINNTDHKTIVLITILKLMKKKKTMLVFYHVRLTVRRAESSRRRAIKVFIKMLQKCEKKKK